MSKSGISSKLDTDTVEKMRDLAWRDRITMGSLIEAAVLEYLAKHERYEPIPKRKGELRRGRPAR